MLNLNKITLILIALLSFNALSAIDVIVHPSNKVSMSQSEIARIYLGKAKAFPDGAPVIPINLDESVSVTAEFNKKVLKKSNSQLKAYWSKLVFTGKGTPPKAVDNNQQMLDLIALNPSMIGFIEAGTGGDKVNVIGTF